ncbi:hypothetical protein LMG28727_07388 [Paraburkholderia kirstenboschensis]|nr:hypothetical protein LMG28727_07388 [Paraburkholderia kirstenboschensis]
MCGLKGVPQRERIAHKSISNIKRLRHVESRETPLCALGIGGLIIAVQACSDVFGIADAMEKEFFDHQARDDLGLANDLQGALLRQQLLLTHEKREQLDLLAVQCIVYISQHSYSFSL